jgi:vacuolar-type H+-ATPase catalytic subunit A/Vma1
LKLEEAEYDQEKLREFVEENYQKGLRDILNLLQISYITNHKKIIFSDLSGKTELEENVIALILAIIKVILSLNDTRQKKQCLIYPTNSVISQDYTNLVTILNNNWDLYFDQIFEELIDNVDQFPAKNIIATYHERLDDKKYPHLHVIACLYEVMEACCKAQL